MAISLMIFELILIGAFSKAIATSDTVEHLKSIENNSAMRRADAIDYLWPQTMETVTASNKQPSPIVRYVRNPNGFIRFGRSDSFVRFGRNDAGTSNRNQRDNNMSLNPNSLVRIGKRGGGNGIETSQSLRDIPDNVLFWLNNYAKQHRPIERDDIDASNSEIGSIEELLKSRSQPNSFSNDFYEKK